MRFSVAHPKVAKAVRLGVCGLARIISKTALYLLKGIDTMSINIMKADEAYRKTMEVIELQNMVERELAEEFIQSTFIPALSDAIKRGRSTMKLSITPEVNAYTVSNILRENGYRTRVSCARNGYSATGKSSITVFWNPDEEDD